MADDELKTIAEARLGRVLRGKYRLDRVLGIGGMATVYAATHRNKKRVAIKMLHPELSMRENIRTRFLREGYVANSVDHPGAVSVHDDDVAEDGSAFLVMELLEGSSVEEVSASRDGRRLPLGLVLSVGDALLEVLDFGIARLHDETGGEATAAGAMMGTPAYMAPEQALGESNKIDAQTDLWAVGATLFVLLSGMLVHDGANGQQLMVNAATKKARSLASVAEDVPRPVADVIDKALTFDKGERWASAKEMRDALRKACVEATGAPVSALPKNERVTGLEDTIALAAGGSSGSGGEAFDPTVDALAGSGGVGGAAGAQTTAAAVSRSHGDASTVTRRKAPWRWVVVGLLVTAVVAGGARTYRAARAPRARYCLDIEDTKEGPRCIFEVGADVVPKRHKVINRVTELAGRVVSVEHVNFAGTVDDGDTDFARLDVIRAASGAVQEVKTYDRFGVNLQWQKWSEGGTRIDLVDIDGKTPRHASKKERFTTKRLDYDNEGRVKVARYFGPTGRPRPDADGVYGSEFEYGKAPGLATKVVNLGADGAAAADALGVVVTRHADNEVPSEWRDSSYFDATDAPTTHRGFHTWKRLHDDYEITSVAAFGLHGEPVVSFDQTVHEIRMTWNPTTHIGEAAVFDEHGRPGSARGVWIWAQRVTFDQRGREVLLEALDGQGNRVLSHDGVSAMRRTYDDVSHEIACENLDPSGSPMQDNESAARWERQCDAHDNVLEARAYDVRRHLAPSKDGAAIERATFDDRDGMLAQSHFDANDHPVATVHGFSADHRKYDHLRNVVEVAYFDADGKATLSDEGFAIRRWIYDENDDLVAESFFDATGAPILFQSSYATRRMKNDERGLVIEEEYLDVHGDSVLAKNGYASVKRTRDRNGDVTSESYFGKKGEPILREGGFASRTTSYDVTRRPTEVALFETAGQPVQGTGGWAIERTTYDERGLVVRVDQLDAGRRPALDGQGRASVTKVYDSRGNVTEETSLDTAGKPALSSEGYSTKKSTYDDHDEVVAEALFGASGGAVSGDAGWSLRRVRYDDFGAMTEESFFDGAHEPIVPRGTTYSSRKQRLDERHRLVESTYFDTHGVATKGPDGAAIVRFTRDSYGRAIGTSYLDGTGTPSPSNDGRVGVRSTFDDVGHLVDERFVDAAGAPRVASDGCAGHHTKYDALGRKLEESCLDAKDALTLSTDGWALRRTLYDARGNAVDISTYGPDGTLHADPQGFARHTIRYDDRNLVEDTAFLDATGKPVPPPSRKEGYGFSFSDDAADARFAPALAAKASMDLNGRLPAEAIQAIVRQSLPTFKRCYEAGAAKNPRLEGLVKAKFVIELVGTVSKVDDGGSTLADKAVVSCVLDATAKLTFPKRVAGGVVTVVYPIRFMPPAR